MPRQMELAWVAIAASTAFSLAALLPAPFTAALFLLWMTVALTSFILVLRYRRRGEEAWQWATTVLAPAYIGMGGFSAILLRQQPQGKWWILMLVATVAAGDTAAYYTGKALGRHKLHRALSKGKTWEGTGGGLVGSALAAAVSAAFLPGHNPYFMALMGLLLGAVAQMGDLAESLIKRSYGFKDSGAILPGHGGVLDRIDGHLFAAPLLYWLLMWMNR